ncbi:MULTISPECIES: hypothetical protein [Acidianus]|jgi:hypothetical protein|uniref:Uncharacterized protein n=1 Tax=Acidianus ambivalens TaxID=2283 RepID=A0A650CWI5_ACIAM|nr:hypothetical protein [Acidianus ambivalens]MQL54418.1 hypothetical protein [Acidianus ambivalens]QGR22239.1 hypothetical protein D1866_09780 [Acidianus ambivalens]
MEDDLTQKLISLVEEYKEVNCKAQEIFKEIKLLMRKGAIDPWRVNIMDSEGKFIDEYLNEIEKELEIEKEIRLKKK